VQPCWPSRMTQESLFKVTETSWNNFAYILCYNLLSTYEGALHKLKFIASVNIGGCELQFNASSKLDDQKSTTKRPN
jgi:hypothetical protein